MQKKMMRLCLSIYVVLGLCAGATTAVADISPAERQSLVMLYEQTGGDLWKINTGWKEPPLAPDGFALPGTENRWYGVTCNRLNTKVTTLRLPQQGLEGEDLFALSGLVNLRVLDLSDNNLSGNNFAFLSSLVNLRNLNLRGNLFDSPIIPAVSQLGQLRKLNLSQNRFGDENIAPLVSLINLAYLDLSHNRFNFWNPLFIQDLPQLEHLDLSDNLLSGRFTIQWNQLQYVDLGNNDLEWEQFSLAGGENLEYLDFSHNRSAFNVSGTPLNGALKYLDLSQTQVSSFPDISGLQQLEYVDLSNCGLSDRNNPVPFLGGLGALKHLDISHNRLGSQNQGPPIGGGATALEYLDMSYNRFAWQGPISFPDSVNLKHVDLSHNKISAFIDLMRNLNLEFIDVSYNVLTDEPIQENISALQHYDASHNNLRLGDLDRFNGAPRLKHLDVSHNKLGGYGFDSLQWLANTLDLIFLDLSNNQFRFDNLEMLRDHRRIEVLNLSNNRIIGQMPFFDDLAPLRVLNLAGNQLSGPIHLPVHVETVNLSRNHFDISALQALCGSPDLKQMFLNGNTMIGPVPSNIVYLDRLDRLNIGYNGLYTDDPDVIAFLAARDPDWETTQTVAPANITVTQTAPDSVSVGWDPIAYVGGQGGYAVSYSQSYTGPFLFYATTLDKTASDLMISGLEPGTEYFFKVQTQTEPLLKTPNVLISEPGEASILMQ